MGQQILRPTYVVNGVETFMYCVRCGWEKGWYLLKGAVWPGKVDFPRAEYDSGGAPICPKHRIRGRTRARGGRKKREWLEKNGYVHQSSQVSNEVRR